MKVALEVNNYVVAFVPVILIPLSIPLILIRDQNRKFVAFAKPIGQMLVLPIYFTLVILLMLIQIFNTSILGLSIVVVLIILIGRKKWGFVEGRAEICVIQLVLGIYLVLAFLSSMEIINFKQIEFWGLECLKPSSWAIDSNKGYFSCLILAFFVANLINSFFGYQKIHSLIKKYGIKVEEAWLQEEKQKEEEEKQVPQDDFNKEKYQNLNRIRKLESSRLSAVSELEMEHFQPDKSELIADKI